MKNMLIAAASAASLGGIAQAQENDVALQLQ